MPGIEICRAFFFIHTKKNYFRSSVSEEEIHMKNSYFVYCSLCFCVCLKEFMLLKEYN